MGLYAFIPRLIWPGKPVITSMATKFNELLTGNPESASSPGIYGDLYWEGGWPAVIIGSFILAIMLSFVGSFSMRALETRQWHLLPIIMLGLRIGYRVDGWFAADYINIVPIMLAYYLLFSILGRGCRAEIVRTSQIDKNVQMNGLND